MPRNGGISAGAPAAVLIAVSLLFSSSPAASQATSGVSDFPRQEARRLSPEEIPEQGLVSMFFIQAAHYSADVERGRYQVLLEELSIPAGSDGDRALAEAARAALKVIDWTEWPEGSLGAPNAEEIHDAAMLRKATALAEVYGSLLLRLSSIEGAADRVARLVEKKRHAITVTQIGEDTPGAIASQEAFSTRVRELLQTKPRERFQP